MRISLLIRGQVQGVGFRPFICRTARQLSLNGSVANRRDSVLIILEGKKSQIERFKRALQNPPPNAIIDEVEEREEKPRNLKGFRILGSSFSGELPSLPKDVSVCDKCIKDFSNPTNRRYSYPFTSCCDCGPRFTIIKSTPYDRKRTSFGEFKKCGFCEKEYKTQTDRRYHAETISCPDCGPSYKLFYKSRELRDPIPKTIELLRSGKAVIIKGWGGMHIACDATNEEVVSDLRKKLGRPTQPFAVLCRDISQVRKIAEVSQSEEEILKSREKPIVILNKKKQLPVSDLHTLAVLLPYSPLHFLLFREIDFPLVFTSANFPDLPMATTRKEAESMPFDYLLLHNLEIQNRCDDSIIKVTNTKTFVRKARGFAPDTFKLNSRKTVLALGAELQNTTCFLTNGRAVLSQHLGNCTSLESLKFLRSATEKLITKNPETVVCDLNPAFLTTKLAKEYSEKFGAELLQVQHHHAHALSLLAEHDLSEGIIITADGIGYGIDNTAWGGEVLHVNGRKFERVGGLERVPMPGLDLATRYPKRMLLGFLSKKLSGEEILGLFPDSGPILKQISENFNCIQTSSAGRFLDACAFLLGTCRKRTYEGEPSMKLEALAHGGKDLRFPVHIKDNQFQTTETILSAMNSRDRKKDIAYSCEEALAKALSEIALRAAEDAGIKTIGISGGVFYNTHITNTIKRQIPGLIQHRRIPPGDGGISLGQVYYCTRPLNLS